MQPHDHLFRAVFGQPEHAEGLLRTALPASVGARIDWRTLRPLPSNVIDSALRERYADLLFSVKLDDTNAFVFLLLEHQSTSDPLMPLRMLGYMHRIWEDFLKSRAPSARLPLILPIVCHHSRHGWSEPLAFQDLLDLPASGVEDLQRYVPHFEIVLDDLSRASDDDLRQRVVTALGRIALVCLTKVRETDDVVAELSRFRDAFAAVLEAPTGVAALELIVSYIIQATEAPPEHLQPFFRELGKGAEEAFMTGAEILIERGRAEGKAEGKAELLLRLLEVRFGELPEPLHARLQAATMRRLTAGRSASSMPRRSTTFLPVGSARRRSKSTRCVVCFR